MNTDNAEDRTSGQASVSIGGDREIYDDRSLPIIKRTWFWLLAGLLILGSGIIIGLALHRLLAPEPVVRTVEEPRGEAHARVAALEVRRRRHVRRVAELERLLGQDVCALDAASIEAPGGVAGVLPQDTPVGQTIADPSKAEAENSGQSTGNGTPGGPSNESSDTRRANSTPEASDGAKVRNGDNSTSPEEPLPPADGPASTKFGDVLGPATVLVIVSLADGSQGLGSGFMINNTDIVTNAHVLSTNVRKIVVTNRKLNDLLPASLVNKTWQRGTMGGADFALLRLFHPVNGIAPLSISLRAEKAQEVVAAGFPGDDLKRQVSNGARPDSTFTRGAIRVIERYQGRHPVINHDADIRKGNSGGPLVDKCGQVIGVNTYGLDNLDFAQSSEGLVAFLRQQMGVRYQLSNKECVS